MPCQECSLADLSCSTSNGQPCPRCVTLEIPCVPWRRAGFVKCVECTRLDVPCLVRADAPLGSSCQKCMVANIICVVPWNKGHRCAECYRVSLPCLPMEGMPAGSPCRRCTEKDLSCISQHLHAQRQTMCAECIVADMPCLPLEGEEEAFPCQRCTNSGLDCTPARPLDSAPSGWLAPAYPLASPVVYPRIPDNDDDLPEDPPDDPAPRLIAARDIPFQLAASIIRSINLRRDENPGFAKQALALIAELPDPPIPSYIPTHWTHGSDPETDKLVYSLSRATRKQ
ncbi:hypothetical protein FB451DRAFT_531197 [Mycena latifolia]|nr:hypothetical protein FB451DRAFT_531197 [Mycena latifolia]